MSAPVTWVVLAIVAGIVEMISPTFGFVFISAAALLAAAVAAVGIELTGQVVTFSIALLLGLLLVRPRLVSKLGAPGVPSRTEALLGQQGKITVAIDPVLGTGRVTVAGQDWAARSAVAISVDTIVRVDSADGIVLHVSAADSHVAVAGE